MPDRDYYAVLDVSNDATQKDISKAFRSLARKLHPDKQPPCSSKAAKDKAKEAFQELSRANEVLSDPDKRSRYDCGESPDKKGSSAAAAEPRAAASRSRHDDPFEVPKEKRAAEQTYREKMRKEEDEREMKRQGLGSHWVKPPVIRPSPKKWEGWTKSGSAGPANNDDDDAKSDASSVLSFDIGMNINDLDLDSLIYEPLDLDEDVADMSAKNEVWRPHAPDKRDEPNKSDKKKVDGSTTDTGDKAVVRNAAAPKCCHVQ